jgi:hypothetical protein
LFGPGEAFRGGGDCPDIADQGGEPVKVFGSGAQVTSIVHGLVDPK